MFLQKVSTSPWTPEEDASLLAAVEAALDDNRNIRWADVEKESTRTCENLIYRINDTGFPRIDRMISTEYNNTCTPEHVQYLPSSYMIE